MTKTVQRMEGKRSSKNSLSSVLDALGQRSNALNNVRAVKGSRCDQVGDREAIQHYPMNILRQQTILNGAWMKQRTNAQGSSGSTVSNGTEPSQLGLVDSKMRRVGTGQTLLVEDLNGS